jgi:mitogen-activated protein kinase 15
MDDEVENHILKRFHLHKKIGKGAYGVVYKATDKKTKEVVALKKLYGAFRDDTDSQRTFREVMLLQELNGHDNIIRLLNVIKAENDVDLYLIFEYMEADLYNVIRSGILQEVHKKFIIYQLLKAIKFLHSGDIIHRDLKPSNVFINSDCQIKIGDFGLARTLTSGKNGFKGIITDYVATRWYRAPEMLMGSTKYAKPIDMWSVGCILYELITAKPLFPGKSTKHMFNLVLEVTGIPDKFEYEEIKRNYEMMIEYHMIEKVPKKSIKQLLGAYTRDSSCIDFLSKLLSFNPDKRLTVEDALSHTYMEDFHNPYEEIICEKKITITMDDTQKFSIDEYRAKLYEEILKRKMEIRNRLIESIKKKTNG